MLFSIVAAPIYTPTKTVGRFPFVSDLCSNYSLWIFLMMAILTTVRWFISVVLICIDLIISHLEYVSMCFLILYNVSTVYLLKLASWTWALFWNLFLRVGRPIQRSSAPVLKLLLWEMATRWQHFFLPNSGYLDNQSLCESPSRELSLRVEGTRRNT